MVKTTVFELSTPLDQSRSVWFRFENITSDNILLWGQVSVENNQEHPWCYHISRKFRIETDSKYFISYVVDALVNLTCCILCHSTWRTILRPWTGKPDVEIVSFYKMYLRIHKPYENFTNWWNEISKHTNFGSENSKMMMKSHYDVIGQCYVINVFLAYFSLFGQKCVIWISESYLWRKIVRILIIT